MFDLEEVKIYMEKTYPLPQPEIGYLLIKTRYYKDGTLVGQNPDDQNIIDANAEVAARVRMLVQERCGYLTGAVVAVDNHAYNIILAVRLYITSKDPDPLNRLAEDIAQIAIANSPVFNSSIDVESVDKAKAKETRIATGFQGPP